MLIVSLLFLLPSKAFAVTSTVNVSTTGDSSVNVNSSVNSSSSNTSTNNSTTHTYINENGKVYESDTPGDVTIKSDDGNTTVHVDNTNDNSSSTQIITGSPASTLTPGAAKEQISSQEAKIKQQIAQAKAKANAKKQLAETKQYDLKTFFQTELESLKNFFSKLF